MAALYTGRWIQFFQQAGIPQHAAATYALTFAENRIQMNMLLDLNKEYLRDMGITVMGDVIAILRHARKTHEEMAREKLLVTNTNKEKTSTSAKSSDVICLGTSTNPGAPAKKSTPASRVLDHYTHDVPTVALPPKPQPVNKEPARPSVQVRSAAVAVQVSAPAPAPAPAAVAVAKRKLKPTSRSEEATSEEDVSVKKARRVLPEEEGGYKIRMPSGSTPRSQQILAKSKELARRQTVFQRLGSGTNLSTSSATKSPPSAPAVSSTTEANAHSFTITGLRPSVVSKKVVKTNSTTSLPAGPSKSSSVFRRLGDKQVSSSTSVSVKTRDAPLQYAGILKTPEKFAKKVVKQKPVETVTMVADSVDSGRTEVRERLGAIVPKKAHSEFSSDSRKAVPDSSRFGVKARLGGTTVPVPNKREVKGGSSVGQRLKLTAVRNSAPYSVRTSGSISTSISVVKRGVFSRLGT